MKDKEGHGSEAQDKAEHHGRWNMESGKGGKDPTKRNADGTLNYTDAEYAKHNRSYIGE